MKVKIDTQAKTIEILEPISFSELQSLFEMVKGTDDYKLIPSKEEDTAQLLTPLPYYPTYPINTPSTSPWFHPPFTITC